LAGKMPALQKSHFCFDHVNRLYTAFWKVCNYMELKKPSFNSGLSRKDERITKSAFPKDNKWACRLFSSYYLRNAKERICEYLL